MRCVVYLPNTDFCSEINKERLIGFAQAATAMSGPQFHETSPIKRVDRLRAERNYEEIIPLLLNKGTKSLLSRSFRRSLVDEAVNCGQLGTAVKLAVCNSLNVADISAGDTCILYQLSLLLSFNTMSSSNLLPR